MNVQKIVTGLLLVFLLAATAGAEEQIGLKAGEKAPDFTAVTTGDTSIRLSDFLKKGPVILVFYRGGWCPYGMMQLEELQHHIAQFQKAGAQIIAVSVDLRQVAAQTVAKRQLSFTVVTDPAADIPEKYNVIFHVPEDLRKAYKEDFKIDLMASSGRSDGLIAIPATYVIRPDGVIAHADKNYKIRPPVAQILEALKQTKDKE